MKRIIDRQQLDSSYTYRFTYAVDNEGGFFTIEDNPNGDKRAPKGLVRQIVYPGGYGIDFDPPFKAVNGMDRRISKAVELPSNWDDIVPGTTYKISSCPGGFIPMIPKGYILLGNPLTMTRFIVMEDNGLGEVQYLKNYDDIIVRKGGTTIRITSNRKM